MSILEPGLQQRVANEVGTPAERLLKWGPLCVGSIETMPLRVISSLETAMRAQGLDPVVTQVKKEMQGRSFAEQLALLENAADAFLPTGGELFTWKGKYGIYWGGVNAR